MSDLEPGFGACLVKRDGFVRQAAGSLQKRLLVGIRGDVVPACTANASAANAYPSEVSTHDSRQIGGRKVSPFVERGVLVLR